MSAYNNPYSLGVSDDVFAVTKTDADGIVGANGTRPMIRQLYVTGAGDVKYTSVSGVIETLTLPAGFTLNCAIRRVWSTGTTATGLIGFV